MFGTTEYVAMIIAAIMVTTIGYYKFTIVNLESEVVLLEKSAVVAKFNYDDCRKVVQVQSDAVIEMNRTVLEKTKEIKEWKAKPDKIRYNTIYKKIYVNVDKNNTTALSQSKSHQRKRA